MLVLVLIAGCGGSGGGRTISPAPTGPSSRDKGDFVLKVEAPQSSDDQAAATLIKDKPTLRSIVDSMNGLIALPADITIRFTSTDKGPAYDPAKREIVIGYSFVKYVSDTFAAADPTKTNDVIGFVMVHELGHALVDQLHLAITGPEEDSVDSLSTVVLVDALGAGSFGVTLDVARFFSAAQKDPSRLHAVHFWDDHSLDAQRVGDMTCLVYGSDPSSFPDLARLIAPSRRTRCADEWVQARSSWENLLGPALKP